METSIKKEPEEYRPLNVKDALTYLDKVKAKFSSEPEVYNHFLDIMKDFKSQIIDTPGVIERVSTLFRGNPVLISGFNTFLPPGYRIECSVDEKERNIIKVTTPSGTTSVTDAESLNLKGDTTEERKTPVEFNHAITYVNKIKNRFVSQPNIYKKFLEILQTYQKDQKPIQDVYSEVKVLFNGSNELLDEFKQFLPEPKQRKKRLGIPSLSVSKRTKHHHRLTDHQTSNVRSNDTSDDEYAKTTFSAEEAEFFDKVKAYIGNKATYNAFLKVLNLFSQQIVDQNVLVNRVESFIGNNKELFDWFKSLVGYEGGDDINENIPTLNNYSTSTKDDDHSCGPSYRHVQSSWQHATCSGRDALCWDVLNDTYISHPTWASEDTGFVAAKKNQYEEALHRVEEERYDYDLNIEANLNTIALLEPIAKKISMMTSDEKANFRLSPGLGISPSATIYQRIIKKIYGVEKGLEIIHLLHNNPSQAVPIVLKRLKQKDDEWKRAQREWNKIWREVEAKNYWKSLDYQGITFKMTDRKAMSTRFLISQAGNTPFLYQFKDDTIFNDISRLLSFFLTQQPVYNREDCESMRLFLHSIIPLFFDITSESDKEYNFFGDNAFYCFFRLYQILYDRLYKMKALDTSFRRDPERSKKACEEASDLGISSKRFKALKIDIKQGCYSTLLSLVDKFFEGEIDQQIFEETVRYIFGTDAYIMFTVDKLVLSLLRHIHIIITDNHSQELFELFKNEHKAEEMGQHDLATYRTQVAGIIDPMDSTYHISFKTKSRTFSILLLDRNKNQSDCGGYDEYVSNYINWTNETKGINQSSLTPRFLKRNLKYKDRQRKSMAVRSGMQYKICRDTYHMFYIIGTEDTFIRRCRKPNNLHSLNTQWKTWLDSLQ
ncbi:Sin3 family co-repressor-domain-containing protein [Pilobolus umbonatus]|nr:Sin3 family co-repressor-domain-containing protein [Pilobolus umbonatus]